MYNSIPSLTVEFFTVLHEFVITILFLTKLYMLSINNLRKGYTMTKYSDLFM